MGVLNVQDDFPGVAFEPFFPVASRSSGGVAKEQIYDNVGSQPRVEGQAFGDFGCGLLLIAGFALYTT